MCMETSSHEVWPLNYPFQPQDCIRLVIILMVIQVYGRLIVKTAKIRKDFPYFHLPSLLLYPGSFSSFTSLFYSSSFLFFCPLSAFLLLFLLPLLISVPLILLVFVRPLFSSFLFSCPDLPCPHSCA